MGNCLDKSSQEKATGDSAQNKATPPSDSAQRQQQPKKAPTPPPEKKVITEMKDFHVNSSDFVGHRKCTLDKDYSVLKTLGSGSFGEVFSAIHKPTNILRAIKAINKESTSAEEKRKLINEVRILKTLVNPVCGFHLFLGVRFQ